MAADLTSPPEPGLRSSTEDPVERLAQRFWIDWQRRLMRRFPGLQGLAGDGHFLVTAPPVAVLAPPLTVLWFAFVGATRYGYDLVWSESLALMTALIVLGTLSGVLGVLGTAALALADFAIGAPWQVSTGSVTSELLQVRLPMVIAWLLLAVVVVVVPRTGRGLALAIGRSRRIPRPLAWPLASIVVVLVAWIGTRTWVAAAPTLVRPRFTWQGGEPPVEAIAPLQEQATVLVATAIVAAILRQLWVGATMVPGPLRRAVDRAEVRPTLSGGTGTGPAAGPSEPGPVRRGLSDVVGALVATMVLAGILEQAWLALVTFTVFLVLRLLRSDVLAVPGLEDWKRLVVRLPAAIRLVVLWILARVATNAVAGDTVSSYTGLALFVVGGSVVVWLVFPGRPREEGPPSRAVPPAAEIPSTPAVGP